MRLVIAIGGNALLKRDEIMSANNQRANMNMAALGLADACAGHEIALVHGNGPQVGLLALEADLYKAVPPYPLDVLGAESQGMIGYIIAQSLRSVMPDRQIAAMLTQVVVDPSDTAFARPNKPIGPVYEANEAAGLGAMHGWAFAADGSKIRRVVASPMPVEILELPVIERLVATGVLTICCGGGGVPVRRDDGGHVTGIEAVIDKDRAACLLAQKISADCLVILTDVDGLYQDWQTPNPKLVPAATVAELRGLTFAEGSMAPKVEAACQFVSNTGKPAFIGNLQDAAKVIAGLAGTRIEI